MKKLFLTLIIIIFVSGLCFAKLPTYPRRNSPEWAFSIKNTITKSEVVYGVNARGGKVKGSSPVYNYWYRPSGNNPREVNYLENKNAYGVKSQKVKSSNTVEIVLRKYPRYPLTITVKGSKVFTYIKVDGKTYVLKYINVVAKKSLVGVKVKYATLVLLDENTHKVTYKTVR